MPKKHTPTYAHTKPSYVHPSLHSSRSPPSPGPSEPQSVNARIQQLRREQAPRPTPEQREELALGVSRTVPPELRRILHIPEVNAPKPKAGTRTRRVPGATRPPPGPAAPTSWLQQSRHAPAHLRNGRRRASLAYNAPRFSTLARATDAALKRLPPPRSLVHQCLRTFALHWEDLVEYEQHYITSLPTSLKEALLSYLAIYRGQECLDFRSLKILFQAEEGMGTLAWDETRLLDLTGLLNEHLTLSDVGKCLKRSAAPLIPDMGTLSISEGSPGKAKHNATAEVADSWEEELEPPSPPPSILAARFLTPHFTNLSRLSLAHPGRAASWPDLLRISPNLNKITHLSLANWPRPSATPNANTTSMVSNHTSVALGGSHFYSDLDEDWHEAANILRRFSVHTYSLEWLDLEGCFWLPALTWQIGGQSLSTPPTHTADIDEEETWDLRSALPGPDWNDAWRRISYLNVFQGWVPCDNPSLQNMPAGVVPVQLMRWLREHKDKEDVKWRLNGEETGYAVQEWVRREKVARIVAGEIQAVRRKGEGAWCGVDFGWGDRAEMQR
ncbi:hypothetical protein T440DRAFT_221941 [Plenodomus tracheiphilus IPT5]|uniref:Tafazzin n=1 Tax=Plenodomus tracheiphilus IPT5 TaxID=1408161 RepID=A0A6A7ATQ9_9PLEO|nr:hypothetical protein T440DRAFT_221941 [Plenodomus tracheiphilus IPT5]